MGLKKYIGFSLLYIVLLGLFVYSFEGGKYTVNILDIPITLPIAIWIVLPVFILALMTIFHLMFYGTKNMLTLRKIKKDSQKFTQRAKEALLGKEVDTDYKSEVFKLPGAILPLLNSDPNKAKKHRVHNDDIQDIIDIKEQLKRGEVVDLSEYNLKKNNPYMLQNYRNRLKKDPDFAISILTKCDDELTCDLAFENFLGFGSFEDIKRFQKKPSKKVLYALIDRLDSKEHPINISNDELISYMKDIDKVEPFDSNELIDIMKRLRSKLTPDRVVILSSMIANDFPHRGGEAYLYTMFDLQKIDDAREFLENASDDEYPKFRYLLFLKDQGKNFDIDLFV